MTDEGGNGLLNFVHGDTSEVEVTSWELGEHTRKPACYLSSPQCCLEDDGFLSLASARHRFKTWSLYVSALETSLSESPLYPSSPASASASASTFRPSAAILGCFVV